MPAAAATGGRRIDGRARAALRKRLEARREEIEAAALIRVRAISDPSKVADPAYVEGLRVAVAAAIAYGIEATGRAIEDAPPIPVALLAQARMAARSGINLDTVLRRYFAGYSLLGYFQIEEAGRERLIEGLELQRLIAAQAGVFDRLLAAIGEEHMRELESLRASSEPPQAERIERLLAGEPLDTLDIAYEFDGWHLGVVAIGPGAEQRVRKSAADFDCRLLCLPREGGVIWAWLGSRRHPDPLDLARQFTLGPSTGKSAVALGEPDDGLAGWRLTHRQAAAALPIARRARDPVVRYRDVALLASVAEDDLLSTSLHRIYLAPLAQGRDGGETLRRTLHAYLSAGGNVTSAALALGVKRHTVTNRLRTVEEAIGCPVGRRTAEIGLTLQLHALTPRTGP